MHCAATAAHAKISQVDFHVESAGKSGSKFVVAVKFSGLEIPHASDMNYICQHRKGLSVFFYICSVHVLNLLLSKKGIVRSTQSSAEKIKK